jgi:hypothetical protein
MFYLMGFNEHRQKLAFQYATELKSNPLNHAYSCVFSPDCKVFFDARPTVIPTMSIRVLPQLNEAGIDRDCIARTSVRTPPWRLRTAVFLCTLHQLGNKNETAPDLFKSAFRETLKAFDDYGHMSCDFIKCLPPLGSSNYDIVSFTLALYLPVIDNYENTHFRPNFSRAD